MSVPRADGLESFQKTFSNLFSCINMSMIRLNKTRQGYARERILKPAGYFLVRGQA